MKVGKEVFDNSSNSYIITDILGDGKFKAVPKNVWDDYGKVKRDSLTWQRNIQPSIETFDISVKKSPYQLGIKLTPEIKAKIQGEAPKFEASGKQFIQ